MYNKLIGWALKCLFDSGGYRNFRWFTSSLLCRNKTIHSLVYGQRSVVYGLVNLKPIGMDSIS